MTAPNGAIKFNNSTGSDTQSSGLGPAVAVYGSGASTTGASAVVTGISTAGVSAGDLLWVQSSSGRQFSIIATVDSSTQVTCDDVFANTESGRTWAIGGKRATFSNADSRQLFSSDIPFGSTVEIEYTGTHYSTGGLLTLRAAGTGALDQVVTFRGTGSQRPRIQGSAGNSESIRASGNKFENLEFENLATTGQPFLGGSWLYVYNCKFIDSGSATNGTGSFLYCSSSYNSIVANCEFVGKSGSLSNAAIRQYYVYGWYGTWNIVDCKFSNFIDTFNGEEGMGISVKNCVFTDCQNGINHKSTTDRGGNSVTGCVFHNLSGDAVKYDSGHAVKASSVSNTIFSNIGGNAISASSVWGQADSAYFNHNAFYNITGSNYSNLNAGSNDITLTADPFVDAANGDFNLNNAAGGGAVLRSTSYTLGG